MIPLITEEYVFSIEKLTSFCRMELYKQNQLKILFALKFVNFSIKPWGETILKKVRENWRRGRGLNTKLPLKLAKRQLNWQTWEVKVTKLAIEFDKSRNKKWRNWKKIGILLLFSVTLFLVKQLIYCTVYSPWLRDIPVLYLSIERWRKFFRVYFCYVSILSQNTEHFEWINFHHKWFLYVCVCFGLFQFVVLSNASG